MAAIYAGHGLSIFACRSTEARPIFWVFVSVFAADLVATDCLLSVTSTLAADRPPSTLCSDDIYS